MALGSAFNTLEDQQLMYFLKAAIFIDLRVFLMNNYFIRNFFSPALAQLNCTLRDRRRLALTRAHGKYAVCVFFFNPGDCPGGGNYSNMCRTLDNNYTSCP